MTHEAGSLPELVQNLVKNWEVEASFKPSLDDWRTIDRENYSFAINGSAPQGAEHMLEVSFLPTPEPFISRFKPHHSTIY